MSGAREHIVELTRSGKYANMRCVADAAGVSRERVRQILNESEEFDGFGIRMGFRLEWDCPDCGTRISLRRSELRMIVHQPAVCRPCAKDYCRSGRHRFSELGKNKNGTCIPCYREYLDEIVEIRTCEECNQPLEIRREIARVMHFQSSKNKGRFHQSCYLRGYLPRLIKARTAAQTHCNNGHEWRPGSAYVYPGSSRQCKQCKKDYDKKRYEAAR